MQSGGTYTYLNCSDAEQKSQTVMCLGACVFMPHFFHQVQLTSSSLDKEERFGSSGCSCFLFLFFFLEMAVYFPFP